MSNVEKLPWVDNVVHLEVETTLDIPPERVVKGAEDIEWSDILILGHDTDGEFRVLSSGSNKAKLLYDLETLRFKLMDGTY